MNIIEFQNRISEADKPIVVDFWAPWCRPCKTTKPILEKLAKEYKDDIQFMPIDADSSRDILKHFKVFGIPTVLTLRNGELVSRVTGSQNENSYRAMFQSLVNGEEVSVPVSPFDRILRLGAGASLVIAGISSSNWLLAGIGGVIAFLGIYDRCPIWRALTGLLKHQ